MTKNDITYVPNIAPFKQDNDPEKLSNKHLKQVFHFFYVFIKSMCFSPNNIYQHLDDHVCIHILFHSIELI